MDPGSALDGPHTIHMGEFTKKSQADYALQLTRDRSKRAPKRNLRIQRRLVSEWEDA